MVIWLTDHPRSRAFTVWRAMFPVAAIQVAWWSYILISRHDFPETCDVVRAAVVGATEHVPVAVPVVVAVASVLRFARRFWGAAVPVLNQVCNVNVINFFKFSIQNNLSIIFFILVNSNFRQYRYCPTEVIPSDITISALCVGRVKMMELPDF